MRLNFTTIFAKEFREVLRDRRTLLFMIAFPTLVLPLMMQVVVKISRNAQEKAEKETISYALFHGEALPDLAKRFEADPGFEAFALADEAQIKRAIDEEKIKVGIVIPENASQLLAAGEPLEISVYYNNAGEMKRAHERTASVVETFSLEQRNDKLAALGIQTDKGRQALLEPVTVKDIGTADMRELMGERIGRMLPYFLIIFTFLGSLYPAIDLGAGEKERGTLETLLLTPVPRSQLVLGKFLVVFVTGTIAGLLSVTSMGIWLTKAGDGVGGDFGAVLQSIGASDLVMMGAMLVPLGAMFAALLISISIYAKTFREAQSLATPLNLLCIVPAMIAMLPGVTLNWNWAMVPITNIALAIRELIKGTMDYTMFSTILLSSTLIATALLFFSTKWFQRESVLFRQ